MFGGPYAWANFTALALGVWAVAQKDSIDAISMVSWGRSTGPGLRMLCGPCSIFPAPVPIFCLFLFPFSKAGLQPACVCYPGLGLFLCLPGSESPE